MRILLLSLGILFASELEVQGDLKVSGSIDAQNNPVKNVGVPQSLTDAINGNVLQDALRDDGSYEYMFLYLRFNGAANPNNDWRTIYYIEASDLEGDIGWQNGGLQALNNYISSGWKISHRIPAGTYSAHSYAVYELKRLIEE
tara:strand:+ start:109 stop:537 length:429 start_codon:yes stop_codon:yes gene_type:complete